MLHWCLVKDVADVGGAGLVDLAETNQVAVSHSQSSRCHSILMKLPSFPALGYVLTLVLLLYVV
jgi:hypothetical protein